jgi:Icc-related predicted phosphoesterase
LRIGYVVDAHDQVEAVPRALQEMGTVDLLVVGGDLTTAGTVERAQRAVERWRSLVPQLLAIAGNMDSRAIDERLAELGVSLDARGVRLGDVGLFGASAGPLSPLNTPYELEEAEIARRLERGLAELAGCRVTICCPHAPPYGTACDRLASGEHVGSTAVRAFVEREQPDLVLCGHIHESRGTDTLGRTRVVNPGPVAAGHFALVEVGEAVSVELDGPGAPLEAA